MTLPTLIISIALLFAGATLLFFIIFSFYNAFAGRPAAIAEKLKFRSREKLALEVDQLIEQEKWGAALKRIRESFFFDIARYDIDLVDKIGNHHQTLLSRLLLISERFAHQIPNLAILEDLFISRSEMSRAWIEASNSYQALRARRQRKTPTWALDEYKNKVKELEDRLATNNISLKSQLDVIFKLLSQPGTSSTVTYH